MFIMKEITKTWIKKSTINTTQTSFRKFDQSQNLTNVVDYSMSKQRLHMFSEINYLNKYASC